MSAEVPPWLAPPKKSIPPWLAAPSSALVDKSAVTALMVTRCEVAFPRLMEMVCSGRDLKKAIREVYPDLDEGLFIRWMSKDKERNRIYREMKKFRAEVWTGKMLAHAVGDTGDTINDVSRDRLAVDTYKWLIQAQNKEEYGDVKQIEITQSISIRAALDQGNSRIIEAELVEDELIQENKFKRLSTSNEDDDE